MRKYTCSICGHVYEEAAGAPDLDFPAGTKWEDIPANYLCPVCRAPKSVFSTFDEGSVQESATIIDDDVTVENVKEYTSGELAAICSNLAKGCEKQRLLAEMEAFNEIAAYYSRKAAVQEYTKLSAAAVMLKEDIDDGFSRANSIAKAAGDRGALRSLVWSEKVSAMMNVLLDRYEAEGDNMLENANVYVCDICGFISVSDSPPDICPVCKVQKHRIAKVEGR